MLGITVMSICIMAIETSKPFAIYQTQQGVELRANQPEPTNAELICIVSHYPSAVRIARQAAQMRQQPLLTSGTGYVGLS
jgi:hypothetical protein